MKPRIVMVATLALTLGLLGAMAAARLSRPTPDYAEAHHAEVRRLVAEMPDTIGPYAAYDQEIPAAAYELLQPNATRARALLDPAGRTAGTLVVVHCRDADDLRGHYPPVCYPANGYRLPEPPRRIDVALDGLTLPANEYRFVRGSGADETWLTVLNFMVLPTGAIDPDDRGLGRLASDYQKRFFGAGQFQVLVDPTWPRDRREAFYAETLAPIAPLIEAMREVTPDDASP